LYIVNSVITWVFDLLFRPFIGGPGWLSLSVFSALASVFGLLVYKYTSNQPAIRAVKDRIKADMLAIKLFKDDPVAMFRCFGGVLISSMRLLRYSLLPLAIMVVPFILVMIQLGSRYQWQPLEVGDEAVVIAQVSPDVDLNSATVSLVGDGGFNVETPTLRIPSENEVAWRIRAGKPGVHELRIVANGETASKVLNVGGGFPRISPKRPGANLGDQVLYPSESPLAAGSAIRSISVTYPDRDGWFSGSTVWLFWLMGLSFVLAYVFKPILRVEF